MPTASGYTTVDLEMTVFELALSAPEGEREAYARQACVGDAELLRRILDRLNWEKKMAGFLAAPLVARSRGENLLVPGQVLADRFEVICLVAEGGMAAVYEARDRKTMQRVAVKVPKLPFRRRLLAELQSALEVTHFNICRVHSIHSAQTDAGLVDFLTMEYLEGETLSQHLRTRGRLPLEEVELIAQQLCAGLAAAHDREVIHGDLKPSNVILTRTKKGGLRAVITDFGLARIAPGLDAAALAASALRGTPDFIAPELWRGASASRASDIYALGVMLYELLTGERPMAKVPVEMRLDSLPTPPHRVASGVPIEWSAKTLACLSPTPDRRPADARNVAAALQSRTRPGVVRRSRIAALALLILLVAAALARWAWQPPPPDVIRLAVLPPETDSNTTVIANGIALDWSSRLQNARSSRRQLVVIPLSKAIRYHVKTPEAAGGVLGATHTLQAVARGSGGQYEVGARLNDLAQGSNARTFRAAYQRSALGDLQKVAAERLSSALGLAVEPGEVPLRPAAYADYIEGLYYLDQVPNPDRAGVPLRRALAMDPAGPLPMLALAQAELLRFRHTGDSGAFEQARQWMERAARVSPGSGYVHLARATLLESAGRLDEADKAYRRALEANPNSGPALRGLASLAGDRANSEEAVELYRKAIRAEPGYFQPVLELGVFFYFRGRYGEAEREFVRVTELAGQLAQAHQNLAAVLTDTAQYERAEKEFQQALSLERTSDTLAGMGALLAYLGRHSESAYYYEQAVALGPEDHLLISNLADAYRRTGRLRDAGSTYAKALAAAERELARNERDAFTRAFAAYLRARLGQGAAAQAEIRRALNEAPQDSKIRRRAVLLYDALGRRDEALKLLEQAPAATVNELSRHPDLADFCRDRRFIELKGKIKSQDKG